MTDDVTTLDVVVGGPAGRTISPDLWGVFLEDINFALDGGLNADLVRNGDFEAGPADRPGWGPLTGWSVESGEVRAGSALPVSSANATYASLLPGDGAAFLVNRGYGADGMPVPAATFGLTLTARTHEPGARLTAGLRPVGGSVSAASELTLPSDGRWHRIGTMLRRPDAARMELVVEARSGRVDLDLVELRPLDASGRREVFRRDLVEAVRRLRPAFVRFPGGCLVHGFGLDNMYHWKTTIGPREQRLPLPNTWGYHQSMAIGYHEYFLLCEELGAAPVPIVAAGVCCQNVPGGPQAIPAGRMPQYVQDVIDLVEYANGAPDTRWGAVRAAAGHPEPFRLRMIGLGNEDVVDAPFVERFAQLTEALRAAHPEIELIGTAGPWPFGRDFEAGWELCRRLGIDLVDEHGYRTPRWLWQNHERYDAYDRAGPAVYLGEWAARSSTVRSAIAEAGYMVALERNADIVRMASYAPLLARVGDSQWEPDLIYFTDDAVLGSAAYDVHRLFAEARGDQVLDVQVSGAPLGHQPEPRLGPTALTCPGARVSFTHIEADGVPLPDVMVDDEHPEAALGVPPLTRRLALTATREDGTEGFQVRLGDPASGTTHDVIVGSWGNRSLIWSRSDDGLGDEVDGPYPFAGVQTGVPRRIEVERDGSRVVVRHDGAVVHDHTDDRRSWPEVVVGATSRTVAGDVERVVTIVNGSDRDRAVRVSIEGVTGPVTATLTALAGSEPEAGAAFEASALHRRDDRVEGRGELALVVPRWSITSLRVSSG